MRRHVAMLDQGSVHLEPKPCDIELQVNLRVTLGWEDAFEQHQTEAAVGWLLNRWAIVLHILAVLAFSGWARELDVVFGIDG
jgi:hypothetical protein